MNYEYERVTTPAGGLRLHLNEHTGGCSPAVIAALRALSRQDAACYPDYAAAIRATANRFGVAPEQVLLTNGLDEGILAAAIAALRGTGRVTPEAVVIVPAFDMYAACADVAGGRVVEVPLAADFAFPEREVLAAVGPLTRLVFLTTPNNPTGRSIPRAAIRRIASAARQALVFVDEAYADFSGETLIGGPELGDLDNLVVGRTFAKAYGLAGLRAGALVGRPHTLAPLRRVVPPYSLNAAAAAALPAALDDDDYYRGYVDQVRRSRELLYGACGRLGLECWQSDANFVLVRLGARAREIIGALAAKGVYVRDRSRDSGCGGCVRITAGLVEHTEACIAALEGILCAGA